MQINESNNNKIVNYDPTKFTILCDNLQNIKIGQFIDIINGEPVVTDETNLSNLASNYKKLKKIFKSHVKQFPTSSETCLKTLYILKGFFQNNRLNSQFNFIIEIDKTIENIEKKNKKPTFKIPREKVLELILKDPTTIKIHCANDESIDAFTAVLKTEEFFMGKIENTGLKDSDFIDFTQFPKPTVKLLLDYLYGQCGNDQILENTFDQLIDLYRLVDSFTNMADLKTILKKEITRRFTLEPDLLVETIFSCYQQNYFDQGLYDGVLLQNLFLHWKRVSKPKWKELFQCIEEVVKSSNHASSQSLLGFFYYNGICVSPDHQKAKDLFMLALNKNSLEKFDILANLNHLEDYDLTALTCLGEAWATGVGCEKNKDNALKLFKRAAEQGFAYAQYKNGLYLENTDKTEALRLYHLATDQGIGSAMTRLALNGSHLSSQKIQKLLKLAIEYGAMEIAYKALGKIYEIQKNFKKAFDLYSLAIQRGFPFKPKLITFYEFGLGTEKDINKAIEIAGEMAALGIPAAICILGVYHERYLNDKEKAIKYFESAASSGYAPAKNMLEELSNK